MAPAHIPAFMSAAAKLLSSSSSSSSSRGARECSTAATVSNDGKALESPLHPAGGGTPNRCEALTTVSATAHSTEHLAYVRDLAGDVLRLARSRELPPRSLSTALWAAAKLPLDRPPGGPSGPPLARTGVGTATSPPRSQPAHDARSEWQAWALEMVRCCVPLLGSFSPQDLSLTLWALATLDCHGLSAQFFMGIEASSVRRLHAFAPQAISNTLWAMAILRYRPSSEWLAAVCAAATPQLPAFGPQALANTAYALAQLEYLPPQHWCARFLDCCHAMWAVQPAHVQLDGGDANRGSNSAVVPPPQSVAQVAWAVARLGLCPTASWLDGLEAAAAAVAPRMNGQDVANVIWSLGVLRRKQVQHEGNPPVSDGSGQRFEREQRGAPECSQALTDRRSSAALPYQADWPPPSASGARLLPLLAAWQRCLAAGAMEPQQLSACLVGAVHLGLLAVHEVQAAAAPAHNYSQLPPALLQRALDCAARQLPAASGQCVANVVWAVARLGCRPPSGWMAAAVGRFVECLEDDDAGPQEIANVWWALGRLRWAPSAEVAQELLSRSLAAARAGDLRSGELTMMLWGVTRLGLRLPKAYLDRLVSTVRRISHQEANAEQPLSRLEPLPDQLSVFAPACGGANASHRNALPTATLVTLLRTLGALGATSQTSSVAAALEHSLWRLAEQTTAQPSYTGGQEAKADAARQVALALHSATTMGISLSPRSGRRPHSRGLAGAASAALRAVLPHCNARDLAMAAWALGGMEAALPLPLLAELLLRAGALCVSGSLAGPGDLPLVLCGLGRLLHVRRQRAAAVPTQEPCAAGPTATVPLRVKAWKSQAGAFTRYGRGSRIGKDRRSGAGWTVQDRWVHLLARPHLAAARSAVLISVSELLQAPSSRRALSPRDVRQLVQGLASCRLAPEPPLLRLLGLALVRTCSPRLGESAMPPRRLAASLCQLAGMRADMHPRVGAVLLRRVRALQRTNAHSRHGTRRLWKVAQRAVNAMVARSVSRGTPSWRCC